MAFLADTNVYVAAANQPAFRERFEQFLEREGPLFVSAVVAAEVLVGIADPARHKAAERALTAGGGMLTPVGDDWTMTATAIVRLGGDVVTKSRSFWNDALLASQCARIGAVLITSNLADYRRLRRVIPVEIAAPFP